MTQDRDEALEIFRTMVLEALDQAAQSVFGKDGAIDADLPRLFKAIDEQVDVLSQRYDHFLWSGYIGTAEHKNDADFLKQIGVIAS